MADSNENDFSFLLEEDTDPSNLIISMVINQMPLKQLEIDQRSVAIPIHHPIC
jgi:hypothetical protein